MVTHPDHDHIEGVLELLQKFPPNKPPVDNKAMLNFFGPLLHHGSARNSLPLEKNVLPPNDNITLVKQVFAFRILLAYKFDRDKWDQIVMQEIGNSEICLLNISLKHVKIEGTRCCRFPE